MMGRGGLTQCAPPTGKRHVVRMGRKMEWNLRQGALTGQCRASTRTDDFESLAQKLSQFTDFNARYRCFWIIARKGVYTMLEQTAQDINKLGGI